MSANSMLRVISISPSSFITITGMVLLVFSIFSTRLRSVFSSALLSECMASAQMAILVPASFSRSLTRKWEYTSEMAAIMIAATIRTYLIFFVLFIHAISF